MNWKAMYDAACAVGNWPDSTNDGGPADLAEEIKIMQHNTKMLLDEMEVMQKRIDELEEVEAREGRIVDYLVKRIGPILKEYAGR